MSPIAALPPAATPAPDEAPFASDAPAEAVADAAAALAWDRIDSAMDELIVVVTIDDAAVAVAVAAALSVAVEAEASVELAWAALSVLVAAAELSVIAADVDVAAAESVMLADAESVDVLELESLVEVEVEFEELVLFEEPSHAAPVSERPARMSVSESMKMITGPASTELVPCARCTTSFGSVLSSHVMNTAAGPFRPSGIWQLSIAMDIDSAAPPTMIWQKSC